ncbi:MAG: hypothetical protein KC470_04945 [Dehalococcoidia bacterium]|nr:hypothetical protein [Dehalococcoidia bacterium]
MTRSIAALFPLPGVRTRLELGSDGFGQVQLQADGRICGRFALSGDDDVLAIDILCIDEAERGYGLGTEAAQLLRDGAAAGGWAVLRAWAPPDRGLAVYFWSRMGLHPLFGERPGGGIWFERELRRLQAN